MRNPAALRLRRASLASRARWGQIGSIRHGQARGRTPFLATDLAKDLAKDLSKGSGFLVLRARPPGHGEARAKHSALYRDRQPLNGTTLIDRSKRAAGIEPASSAWKAETRITQSHCSTELLNKQKARCEMFGEMFYPAKAVGSMDRATPGQPSNQPLRPRLDELETTDPSPYSRIQLIFE